MSPEQRLKRLEEKVKELEKRSRRLGLISVILGGLLVFVLAVLFVATLSQAHWAYRLSFSRQAGDSVYTSLRCGKEKVFVYQIERRNILGIYHFFVVIDKITGKEYPLLMCEPEISAKPSLS